MAQVGAPDLPTPVGVLRAVEQPTYESAVVSQIEHEVEERGHGTLEKLIYAGEMWSVDEKGELHGSSTDE
jgi:hypothetical protein